MKISKIFGFILLLHIGVILILFVQPGCSTTSIQEPTQLENNETTSEFSYNKQDFLEPERPLTDLSEQPYDNLDDFNEEDDTYSVQVADSNLGSYDVVNGDNLWNIAKKFDTTINELCQLNDISKNDYLQIGQRLLVPVFEGEIIEISNEPLIDYSTSSYEGDLKSYLIVPGDSLSKIAKEFGTTVAKIKDINSLTTERIIAGEYLQVPVENDNSLLNNQDGVKPTNVNEYVEPNVVNVEEIESMNEINLSDELESDLSKLKDIPASQEYNVIELKP